MQAKNLIFFISPKITVFRFNKMEPSGSFFGFRLIVLLSFRDDFILSAVCC